MALTISARREAGELLDQPRHDPYELAVNLRDLERVNRFLGGTAVVLAHLSRLLGGYSADKPITILDIATGAGDIPAAVRRWAQQRDLRVRVIATDLQTQVLDFARQNGAATLPLIRHHALQAPFAAGSADVVTCSLTLHHFAPDAAVALLRELDRIARRGVVVNDLRRSWPGYWGARLLALALPGRGHRMTRHDAPLSVLRAYRPNEALALARRAGWQNPRIHLHAPFRMALVNDKHSLRADG
jgi:SAM-dependent methyltransferase